MPFVYEQAKRRLDPAEIHVMQSKTRIICISSGMLVPKKSDNPVSRMHLYLNYGLLGLASILADSGYDTRVFHGKFESPEEFIERILSTCAHSPSTVMLSVPSSFALSWARRACRAIRELSPKSRIMIGGRWVVADDDRWIRQQLPDADEYIQGTADATITKIVANGTAGHFPIVGNQPAERISTPPTLNYSLLHEWEEYHPSLEVSRGCGMGCAFCAEAEEPLGALLAPLVAAQRFSDLRTWYRSDRIHPYLEASLFRPSTGWVDAFGAEINALGCRLEWRTETRVDTFSPRLIGKLAKTGLKVLDLGLESASPTQLARMNKTDNPTIYLRRAAELLQACRNEGVWPKVNVLLYPGETPATLDETEEWLERNRDAIKGLSVGPTILFRYGLASEQLLRFFEAQGARATDPDALDRDGFTNLHLSATLSHDAAVRESTRISRSFMTIRDYFDLKSFSYFPRSMSWEQFSDAVEHEPNSSYSFRQDSREAAQTPS